MLSNPRTKLVTLTIGSMVGLYGVYSVVRLVTGGNALGEFVILTFGLMTNIYTGLLAHYLETGKWVPSTLSPTPALPSPAIGERFSPATALAVLSLLWVASFLPTAVLHEAANAELLSGRNLGVQLPAPEAMRLSAMFVGLLTFGTLFPMLGMSAFFCGWLSRTSLTFRSCLLPATAFVLTGVTISSAADVLATGLPPSADAYEMFTGTPLGRASRGDMAIMWTLSVAVAVAHTALFAVFCRVCTAVGHAARRFVRTEVSSGK